MAGPGWMKRLIGLAMHLMGTAASLAILIGVPLGLLYYSRTGHDPEKEQSKKRPAPTVRVVGATRTDLTRSVELTGPALSSWDTQVVTQVPAEVRKVMADVGDRVPEGSPLAEMNSEVVAAKIRESEAGLAVATSELQRAKALVTQGAGSARRVEDAEAAVSKANALLAVLRLEWKEYTIRVPGSDPKRLWTVIERRVIPGEFAPQNQPLFLLSDLGTIRVIVNLPERHARWMREGATARVTFDAMPGEEFAGTVARILPMAKQGTYTIPVEVHVENPESRIRAGLLARVRLDLERRDGAIVVSAEALLDESGDRATVVTVNAKGVAEHRKVKLGLRLGQQVQVTEGIDEGQRVIIAGAGNAKDGGPVEVLGAQSSPGAKR